MGKKLINCAIISFATLAIAVSVPASPKVDPLVISATIAGHWQTSDLQGAYRVILWNQGYEHVTTGVTAEWIADPNDASESPRVLFTKSLVEPSFFSFAEPKFVQLKGKVRVILSGTHSYESSQSVSCSFDLLPSGVVLTIKPCE